MVYNNLKFSHDWVLLFCWARSDPNSKSKGLKQTFKLRGQLFLHISITYLCHYPFIFSFSLGCLSLLLCQHSGCLKHSSLNKDCQVTAHQLVSLSGGNGMDLLRLSKLPFYHDLSICGFLDVCKTLISLILRLSPHFAKYNLSVLLS